MKVHKTNTKHSNITLQRLRGNSLTVIDVLRAASWLKLAPSSA
jgi:hypothetical protein